MEASMTDNKRRSPRPAARRGTVIVMTIGLLVIVAMIGATFLVIAHLNAKQSAALARKAPAEPVVGSIVESLKTTLADDLYIAGNDPYSDAYVLNANPPWNSSGQYVWQAYTDMPRDVAVIPGTAPLFWLDPTNDVTNLVNNDASGSDRLLADKWLASPGIYLPAGSGNPTAVVFERLSFTLSESWNQIDPGTGQFYNLTFRKEPMVGDPFEFVACGNIPMPAQDIPYNINSEYAGYDLPSSGDGIPDRFLGADTDGDGFGDALLYDTGVTNDEGEKYYAAVRVIDMGGLMNLNTAGQAIPTLPPPPAQTAPVNVDLAGLLGVTPYNNLHQARCEGANMPLGPYQTQVAQQLLQPSGGLPFAIGEEGFLRWLAPLNTAPPTSAGRVYQWAGNEVNNSRLFVTNNGGLGTAANAPDLRPLLTTFNCSRSLMRHPTGTTPTRVSLKDITSTAAGNAARNDLHAKLVSAGVAPREAAHFVANLWAYGSDATTFNQEAFAFSPPGVVPEVYGVVPQLVISEVYAYAQPDDTTTSGTDESGYGYAIEFYNPSTIVTIDVSTYALKKGTTFWNFLGNIDPAEMLVGPGGRFVLFTFGGQFGSSGAAATAADFGFDDTGGHPWYSCNLLDFSGGQGVDLVRIPPSGEEILLDTVIGPQFGFSYFPPLATTCIDARRDDDPTRQRATLAQYQQIDLLASPSPDPQKDHRLTLDNQFPSPDPAGYTAVEGFDVPLTTNTTDPFVNIGDVLGAYFVGPSPGNCLPQELLTYKDALSRGRPNVLGTVTATPSDYPDVPWATLLGEFVEVLPTDTTRSVNSVQDRIYGRVNVNTASQEVLEQLPWPAALTPQQRELAAMYIRAYRDKTQYTSVAGTTRNYGISGGLPVNRGTAMGLPAGVVPVRSTPLSDTKGFMTPGEVAIPLADFANVMLGWPLAAIGSPDYAQSPALLQIASYLNDRDSLYRAVSNLITVNSDVYAAYITVQLRSGPTNRVRQQWRYLAILDRSNCRATGARPAVLLLSEIK